MKFGYLVEICPWPHLAVKGLTKVLLRTTPTRTIMIHLLVKNLCVFLRHFPLFLQPPASHTPPALYSPGLLSPSVLPHKRGFFSVFTSCFSYQQFHFLSNVFQPPVVEKRV